MYILRVEYAVALEIGLVERRIMSDQQHCMIMLSTKGKHIVRVMKKPQHNVNLVYGIYKEASCIKEEKNL